MLRPSTTANCCEWTQGFSKVLCFAGSIEKSGMSCFLSFSHGSLRSLVAFVATSDAKIDDRQHARIHHAKEGHAENTRVSHCNSVQRLSFGSTQRTPCVCLGACATTYLHRDSCGMVVPTTGESVHRCLAHAHALGLLQSDSVCARLFGPFRASPHPIQVWLHTRSVGNAASKLKWRS